MRRVVTFSLREMNLGTKVSADSCTWGHTSFAGQPSYKRMPISIKAGHSEIHLQTKTKKVELC